MNFFIIVSFKTVVVDSIMSRLASENVMGIHTMGDGKLEIIELQVSDTASALGKKLKDISQHGIFLILLVTNEHGCIIPTGETALHEGDKIVLIVKSASSDAIIKIFGGR